MARHASSPSQTAGLAAQRRIVVLGCAGSGKTTLAVQLGERLDLPVVHLDLLYWEPGWQARHTANFLARVADAVAGEGWVSEGNYRETFPLRLPRADAVIIMECSRWLCLWRVLRRTYFRRGRRPDLPPGCPEKVDWGFLKFILRFQKRTWPRIEADRRLHGEDVPVTRLRSKHQIDAFLAGLPQPPR
ncbi:MAG TPA: hypothetical protein VMF86_13840 [Stellaceae bacterium]|nr:hypothetical protein [Stellaceae bacterium]